MPNQTASLPRLASGYYWHRVETGADEGAAWGVSVDRNPTTAAERQELLNSPYLLSEANGLFDGITGAISRTMQLGSGGSGPGGTLGPTTNVDLLRAFGVSEDVIRYIRSPGYNSLRMSYNPAPAGYVPAGYDPEGNWISATGTPPPQEDLAPRMDYLNVDTDISSAPEAYLAMLQTRGSAVDPDTYGGYGAGGLGGGVGGTYGEDESGYEPALNPYGGYGNDPYGPPIPGGPGPGVPLRGGAAGHGQDQIDLHRAIAAALQAQGNPSLEDFLAGTNQGNNAGGNNMPAGTTAVGNIWEESPELAYRQALGIEGSSLNPYQRWLRDLFGDVQSAWQVQQAADPSGTPQTFQDYYAGHGVQGARDFWRGASERMLEPNMFNTLATRMSGGDLNTALSNAMRNRYGTGSIYGSYLGRQMPEATQFYNAQYTANPTTTGSFLDYLRSKYGM